MQRRLERFARDYERRERELERGRDELRQQRDEAIRDAYRDGLTMQDIASIIGLSHQYVSLIVREGPGRRS